MASRSMNPCSFFAVTVADGRAVEIGLPEAPSDPVVAAYKEGRVLNQYLVDLLLRFTDVGDYVLDLGCHVGTFAVPAAALGRHVIAVDASRMHIDTVIASAKHNGLGNLHAIWSAIDSKEGQVGFNENGLWGTVAQAGHVSDATQTVPGRRADSLLREAGWSRVDLVKIDIEGSELVGLESLGALLDGDSAPVVIYESNGMTFEWFGYSICAMRECLEALGYRTYRVEGVKLVYCPPEALQPEAWLDVVALPVRWQFHLATEIDASWSSEAMVLRCLEWGTNEHRNVREYLYRAFRSDATYPRDDPRVIQLRDTLDREFYPTN